MQIFRDLISDGKGLKGTEREGEKSREVESWNEEEAGKRMMEIRRTRTQGKVTGNQIFIQNIISLFSLQISIYRLRRGGMRVRSRVDLNLHV